jgi:hypothetical protein
VANEYESWTGAGEVTNSKIFESTTHEELDLTDIKYQAIKSYLPPTQGTSITHFLVARVATTSKKVSARQVVKLFASGSWNWGLTSWLEAAEFTKVGTNLDQLESDVDIDLPDSDWRAVGRVRIFRDLNPPGRPTARITFENDAGESVSAFWCWT